MIVMPEELFLKILFLSVSGGFVACVLLLARALLWKKISPRVLYALWSLPVLRLLLPFAPESRMSVFWLFFHAAVSVPKRSGMALPGAESAFLPGGTPSTPPSTLPSAAVVPSPMRIAAIVWLAGTLALLLSFLLANLVLRRKLNRLPGSADGRAEQILALCRKELRVKPAVRLAVTGKRKPPAVFGIFRPVVLLPRAAAEGGSETGLRYVFLHELTHVARRDGAVRLIVLLLEAVNWFNPVLWYAFRKLSEDCEISCDARVLGFLGEKERKSYGDAVIEAIRAASGGKAAAGAVGFADSFSKRRILMIASVKKASLPRAAAAVLALVLAGCASLPPKAVSSSRSTQSSAPLSSASEPAVSGASSGLSSRPSPVGSVLEEKESQLMDQLKKSREKLSSSPPGQSVLEFQKEVYGLGYKRLANSGIYGYPVLLPKSFTAEKSGFAVGKFLSARNELSKQNGLDFSSHLGEQVRFFTCAGEKRAPGDTEETEEAGGPGCVDLVALYDSNRCLIAFWEAPGTSNKDESDTAVFTQILSDGDA